MEGTVREKIALFGGTFDPFHKGHLELLQNIHKELCPDRIIIIPTGHPYFKEREGRRITSAEDRMGMVSSGLRDADFEWEISRTEVDREGNSYSIDTISEIRGQLQKPDDTDLYFLCGSDVLFSIDQWYRHRELLAQIILTVTPRGTDDHARILAKKEELEQKEGARVIITEFRGREVSSSAIRDNIESNKDLLPAGTYEYIKTHQLYLTEAHFGTDNQ